MSYTSCPSMCMMGRREEFHLEQISLHSRGVNRPLIGFIGIFASN